MVSHLSDAVDKLIQRDHQRDAIGRCFQEVNAPAEVGQAHEQGRDEESCLIHQDSQAAAQQIGDGAPPPELLPEQGEKNRGEGDEGHAVGPRGGA